MRILTFDIGGANTKKLVRSGSELSSTLTYFPLWKRREELPDLLSQLNEDADATAVTMTAELADTFQSKKEGVEFVVKSCEEVFNEPLFLTLDQRLIRSREIEEHALLAAANWAASLYYMEKFHKEGLLLDVGSTTTDILAFGKGASNPWTDFERLRSGRLIYTGYLRTPVNTIVSELPVDGEMVPIASEHFAITADVYNILWGVEYTCETPDGRGKGKEDSAARIARLLCAEPREVEKHMKGICNHVHQAQAAKIAGALRKISAETGMKRVFVAGAGRRLGLKAAHLAGLEPVDLSERCEHAWNLPCLGLAEMVLDWEKRRCHRRS